MSSDGMRAVSVSWDHLIKLWDTVTGDCIATFNADGMVEYCAISPAGDWVVASDRSGAIHVLALEA
jgi:WD40 repeat protein